MPQVDAIERVLFRDIPIGGEFYEYPKPPNGMVDDHLCRKISPGRYLDTVTGKTLGRDSITPKSKCWVVPNA